MKSLFLILLIGLTALAEQSTPSFGVWQRLFPHSPSVRQRRVMPPSESKCDALKEAFANSPARRDIMLHYAGEYGYQPTRLEVISELAEGVSGPPLVMAYGSEGTYQYRVEEDLSEITPVAANTPGIRSRRDACELPRWP